MLIQIKNQVFVPESQIKRISFFADRKSTRLNSSHT